MALAVLGTLAAVRAGAGEPHLVRFTSERSVLLAGGHPTPGCFTVLTAEIAPAAEAVEIVFTIVDETGRGRTAPAMLSRARTATDARGIAETFVLSSDAQERCSIRAQAAVGEASGGDPMEPLEVSLEFRRTLSPATVAPCITPAPTREPWPTPAHRGAAALARQLVSPSVEIRTAAKRTLLSIGRDAVGALVEVAADPSVTPDARKLAVRTLAEMRTGDADDELLALLGHPLPDVRAGAEETLAMMSAERAGPLAEAALLSSSPSIRAAALRVLALLSTDESLLAMASALGDPDPFVRATAAWGAAHVSGPAAEELLARALEDEAPLVRASAAKAVVLLGPRTEKAGALDKRLERRLSDPDPGTRSAAAKAVGLRESTAETALRPLFADPDERVRLSVAFALTWRADLRSSLRHLRALARDPDAAVREAAWRAIAESGGEAEADVMVEMLGARDPAFRKLAVRALRRVACLDFGWYGAGTEAERAEIVRRWREWWDANGDLRREAWLWQALDLPGSKLRGAAGLELARTMPLPASGPAGELTPDGADHEASDAALRKRRRALVAALARVVDSSDLRERHAAAEALLLLENEAGLGPLEADLADVRVYTRLGAVKAVASAVDSMPRRQDNVVDPTGPRRPDNVVDPTGPRRPDNVVDPTGPRRPDNVVEPTALTCRMARLLVSALEDRSASVRRSAVRPLRELAGETFGYEPRAPAEHRARAVRRWRRWLEDLPAGPRRPDGAVDPTGPTR
jgi:HEAT repeat protein